MPFDGPWLAAQPQQPIPLAAGARHLVHDAARRTDHLVLDQLARGGDLGRGHVRAVRRATTAAIVATSSAADELTPFPSGTSDSMRICRPGIGDRRASGAR